MDTTTLKVVVAQENIIFGSAVPGEGGKDGELSAKN
jgi:hypothetical protein